MTRSLRTMHSPLRAQACHEMTHRVEGSRIGKPTRNGEGGLQTTKVPETPEPSIQQKLHLVSLSRWCIYWYLVIPNQNSNNSTTRRPVQCDYRASIYSVIQGNFLHFSIALHFKKIQNEEKSISSIIHWIDMETVNKFGGEIEEYFFRVSDKYVGLTHWSTNLIYSSVLPPWRNYGSTKFTSTKFTFSRNINSFSFRWLCDVIDLQGMYKPWQYLAPLHSILIFFRSFKFENSNIGSCPMVNCHRPLGERVFVVAFPKTEVYYS